MQLVKLKGLVKRSYSF